MARFATGVAVRAALARQPAGAPLPAVLKTECLAPSSIRRRPQRIETSLGESTCGCWRPLPFPVLAVVLAVKPEHSRGRKREAPGGASRDSHTEWTGFRGA